MKPPAIVLAFSLAAILAAPSGQAQDLGDRLQNDPRAGQRKKVQARRAASSPTGTGTVRYDPGTPTGVRRADSQYIYVGNQFDTQSGAPLGTGTVSRLSWYQGAASSSGEAGAQGLSNVAYIVVRGAGGPTQPFSATGVGEMTTNSASIGPLSLVPPFFVGLRAGAPQEAQQGNFDAEIGFNTQTSNSQGFHGYQMTFTVSSGAPITNQNIAMRVTGNVAIPVELMEFEVD